MWQKIKDIFFGLYAQMAKVNDTPQRIAIGIGVGVCLGIFPGTGPIAALTLAWIFRLNKAATLLGSVLTNTWLSFAAFVFALKIGCAIFGLEGTMVKEQASMLMHHFSWKALWDTSFINIVRPLLAGYAVVGLICGILAYGLTFIVLKMREKRLA